MVLVDINSINQPTPEKKNNQDTPLVKVLNSLVSSNEFSRSEYGSNAQWMASLDAKLKEILETDYDDPAEKVKRYNLELQKYLFHVTKQNTSPHAPGYTSEEDEEEEDLVSDDGVVGIDVPVRRKTTYKITTPATPVASRKSIFDETHAH